MNELNDSWFLSIQSPNFRYTDSITPGVYNPLIPHHNVLKMVSKPLHIFYPNASLPASYPTTPLTCPKLLIIPRIGQLYPSNSNSSKCTYCKKPSPTLPDRHSHSFSVLPPQTALHSRPHQSNFQTCFWETAVCQALGVNNVSCSIPPINHEFMRFSAILDFRSMALFNS